MCAISSTNLSSMKRYLLQPTKSVMFSILAGKDKTTDETSHEWTLNGEPMPKARRTLYSLMSSGLHGKTDLTRTHLYMYLMQTYVMPVLVYGLEVVLPKQKHLDTLEMFNKRFLELILSLPVNVADPAVYILTGTLLVEAVLHKRVLTLFRNICRPPQISIVHQLFTEYLIRMHRLIMAYTII